MFRSLIGGLVLATSLTMLPQSTHASCAWILWFRSISVVLDPQLAQQHYPNLGPDWWQQAADRSRWNLEHVYETKELCQAHIARMVPTFAQMSPTHGREVKSSYSPTSGFVSSVTNGVREQLDWLCLPDTLNPRGIKY